jgi:hypothetical protein
MRLIRATAWIKSTFEEGSRPSKDTVAKWIKKGEVPGRLLGGAAYIDADQFVQDLRAGPTISPGLSLAERDEEEMAAMELLR